MIGARAGVGCLLAGALLSSAAGAPTPATAPGGDEEPAPWLLAPGRYRLVGQRPDGGRSYVGTATIDRVGTQMRLVREIGGVRRTLRGTVRRADPGEAWVLAFAWSEQRQAHEMVCLVNTDLDNYGRLSCHWGRAGNPHRVPGMEAYFAREPWESTELPPR